MQAKRRALYVTAGRVHAQTSALKGWTQDGLFLGNINRVVMSELITRLQWSLLGLPTITIKYNISKFWILHQCHQWLMLHREIIVLWDVMSHPVHITSQPREHNPDIHFCEKHVSHTWMKVQSAILITKYSSTIQKNFTGDTSGGNWTSKFIQRLDYG
jgi:hypothetical protein